MWVICMMWHVDALAFGNITLEALEEFRGTLCHHDGGNHGNQTLVAC